ncbi:MAG: undecaprenyl/decaprenyl-phosphate alpha-N-acetylglucosaminyl 1-phosphate transferase [Candidatus Doudnabacteria bacterium]|nr:undecaprenyl/decaprenyl-phosphate alpha-N-acetylglucosaminyl 1-phosphate transferase [Candidatus Doudnabacteria bacterium]
MRHIYFISFALAFLVSFVGTFLVARIAVRKKILDVPDNERRLHKHPVPTMGGIAVFVSFFLVTLTIGVLLGYLLNGNLPLKILISIWAGGAILMIGGYLDDKYRLSPRYSVIFPIIAALVMVSSGISAVSIHNPFSGEIILLDQIKAFGLPLASSLVVFAWILVMIFTTKVLDGMDGLTTGVSAIASLVLFGLSLTPQVMQAQTALLAIIFAGALLGFLILNFYPAKIFLGEGGSTLAGFVLAVLAIVSGGKIATAVLVLGIPLMDAFWVLLQRLFSRQNIFKGDRKHLHFRLLDIGFSEPQAVLFLYVLSGIFGVTALFLQSLGKLVLLAILAGIMVVIVGAVFIFYKVRQKSNE